MAFLLLRRLAGSTCLLTLLTLFPPHAWGEGFPGGEDLLFRGGGLPEASSAPGTDGSDGTWRALSPPDVPQGLVTYVDPIDGRYTVITGYSGTAFKRFDLAGGSGWSEEAIVGPTPSMNVSLGVVLDLAHRRLVAVGMDYEGYETGVFGEVELWALPLDPPRSWHRIATTGTGPGHRFESSLVLDPSSAMLYAVGGIYDWIDFEQQIRHVELQGDVWRIDLDGALNWEPFPLNGPPLAGAWEGGAYLDPASRKLVLMGARDTIPDNNDGQRIHALELEGSRSWREIALLPDELPSWIVEGGVYDPVDSRILGLVSQERFGEPDSVFLWSFDFVSETWSRRNHAEGTDLPMLEDFRQNLAVDPATHRLIAFGGRQQHGPPSYAVLRKLDVWITDLDDPPAWSRLFDSIRPFDLQWYAPVVIDPQRRRALALGERGLLFGYSEDTLPRWSVIPTSLLLPDPRNEAVCVFDEQGDRLLLYGGGRNSVEYGDLWELSFAFSPARWRRILPNGDWPLPRRGATAVYDRDRRRAIVFGGYAGRTLDETWELDLSAAEPTWRKLVTRGVPPPGRRDAASAIDTRRDGMIVYGGGTEAPTGTTYLSDAWFLSFVDGDVWVPLRTPNAVPLARSGAATFYDPVEDRLVVLGGRDATGGRFDAHALELSTGTPTWADFLAGGAVPAVGTRASAHYDRTADRTYLFGENNVIQGRVHVLEWDRDETLPPPSPGGDLAFRILGVGPNPSRGDVSIAFELSRAADVETKLYDVRGRIVRDLGKTTYPPGPHLVNWDGRSAAGERLRDGVYFAKIVVEGKAISGKIVLMD